jgi:MYXO-CTERM domain-containing protein
MRLVSISRFAAGALTLAAANAANADLLGFTLFESPDIFSGFIDVTYDADTNVFTADGFSLTYNDGVSQTAINNGHFNITATIDVGGVLLGGTVLIEGTFGLEGPTLLTGTLTAFGFEDPPGGDLFDFLFTVTGGSLATEFGGVGNTAGIILDVNNGPDVDGTFSHDFDNLDGGIPGTGQGVSDTGIPVPAPGSLALLALGLLGARRRSR